MMGNWCLQASSCIFDRIFVKLAGNQNRHKISHEFEFWPDRISHFRVVCPWGWIKFSIDILWNLQVQLIFQTLEFFVTLFSGTVRPRRLKLGIHVDSGQLYHVYQNQAAACSSLYFFIFLSPIFNIEIFRHFSRELWYTHEQWADVSCVPESGCCCLFVPLFLHVSFSPIFSIENFITFLRNCET